MTAFIVSLAGLALSTIYQFAMSPPPPDMMTGRDARPLNIAIIGPSPSACSSTPTGCRARRAGVGLGPETEQADPVPSLGGAASPGPRQPVRLPSNALISSLSRSIPSAQRRLISTIGPLGGAVGGRRSRRSCRIGNRMICLFHRVGGDVGLRTAEVELVRRGEMVERAAPPADRAVAGHRLGRRILVDRVSEPAAVTASFERHVFPPCLKKQRLQSE